MGDGALMDGSDGALTDGLGMPHGSEEAAVQAILFMAEMT